MAPVTLLDTHVVVWLHAGELLRFPQAVQQHLEQAQLAISPITLLELQYLLETGRITCPPDTIISDLAAEIGLQMARDPFRQVIRQALSLGWTRDPFDRLLASQAMVGDHLLLTKDRVLLEQCPRARWDTVGVDRPPLSG